MQKVLRRNLLARNQSLRKARKRDKLEHRLETRESFQENRQQMRALDLDVRNERRTRREDWILGPLAPDRNVGDRKGVYGTLESRAARSPLVVTKHRAKYVPYTVGDRVVVVRGRERGKIAAIKEVDEERETVELDGVNIADLAVPEFARDPEKRKKIHTSFTLPMSWNNVRLVIPMRDDATGRVSDVVIRHMRCGEPILEREYGTSTPKHTRYIEGLDVELPWPESTYAEPKAEDCDTLRLTVEEKTYIPSWNPPMPETVIDELRNKFGRTRSRHDPEFIAAKMKEDAKEEWIKRRQVQMPQAEYRAKKAKEKEPAGPPAITAETLELIRQTQRQDNMRGRAATGSALV